MISIANWIEWALNGLGVIAAIIIVLGAAAWAWLEWGWKRCER